MIEAEIKIAAKMYRCRDSVKTLFGENYSERIGVYKGAIEGYMKENSLDTLPALLKICEDPEIKNDGMLITILTAAAVEIIEPSKK